ncbi:MAG: TIR domain-containing protein [Candidatus Krumholzibacteriota bacterium]|nr:TIR domain-containing protein [Candidatus Krumholzibacteriota bacterium]
MGDIHKIFVSYSRKDENAVLPVVQELKSRGLSLWIDQEEIHGGSWRRRIAAGLESSQAMLFMVSRESLKSSRTLSEASMADDHGLPIIPVLLDDVKIAGGQATLKGRIVRLGHIGHYNAGDMKTMITAFEAVCRELGIVEATGPGVKALDAFYRTGA